MNKAIWILLGLAAATLAPAAEEKVFALATAGDVDFALADDVRSRLEAQSGAVVRLAPPVALEAGQALDDVGRAAARAMAPTDFAVIVLARPLDDRPQGVCLPEERFAVLNVAKLEAGADAAQLARRASQDGLRVMAMLLDMSFCPFPLCVLTGYEKVEDLDRMSANYCPPCLDRFGRVARDAGLGLIDKSAAEEAPALEMPAPDAAPAPEPAPAAAE